MNSLPANFPSRAKQFALGFSREIFFTSLFYSLWLVFAYFNSVDFELKNFEGRMIGTATLNGFDVSIRVSLFFKCVSILLLSFLIFNFVGFGLSRLKVKLFRSAEIKIINYSSLAGIIYFVFLLMGFRVDNGLELVYFLHKLMLAAITTRLILKSTISVTFYSILISVSLALYFLTYDIGLLFGGTKAPDLLTTTFIIAVLLFIWQQLSGKNIDVITHRNKQELFAQIFLPVVFLPFLSVLKDEIFLILGSNGHHPSSPLIIWVILILLLATWIFLRYMKTKKDPLQLRKRSIDELLALRYFPVLIFSLTAFILYRHYIDGPAEMFEAANKYLPILEFQKWGVVPILEKFNSHVLNDFFFSSIYSLFSPVRANEIELYDFMNDVCYATLYYFLIYFISRNAYVALFSVILYPVYSSMMPNEHAFAVLGILALHRVVEKNPSLKNYVILLFTLVFLVVWRVDVGVASLIAVPLVFIFYSVVLKKFRFNLKLFLKAFAIVASVCLLIIVSVSLIRHINVVDKAMYAKNYVSSAQTYGHIIMAYSYTLVAKMHYFIFPFILILIFIFLLLRSRSLNMNRKQRMVFLSIMVLGIYYLANFQRGLVRHGLVEGIDSFVSSFIYILLPGCVYIFLANRSQTLKFVLFGGISGFMILNYKLPGGTDNTSFAEKLIEKTEAKNLLPLQIKKTRSDGFTENAHKNIVEFLKNKLDSTETFIDFTNTSMLYYFTQKITPSYFYQNPLCSHNEFLQKKFIEDLKDYKVPYLLFSRANDPLNGIDYTPNCFRHYRMAEYFYRNYHPSIIVDDMCVWIKNDEKDSNQAKLLFSYDKTANQILESDNSIKASFNSIPGKYYVVEFSSTSSVNRLRVKGESEDEIPVEVHYTDFSPYKAYYIFKASVKNSGINLKDEDKITGLTVKEYEYLPDLISAQSKEYEIQKLPYIWGTYDKEIKDEKVLFSENVSNGKVITLKIPTNINRSTGNTLIFKTKNSSGKLQKLKINFHNSQFVYGANISLDLIPSDKEEQYALRISSIYNWYLPGIESITFDRQDIEEFTIRDIRITKGN